MMVLFDFPSIVKQYAPYFESCFSPEGYLHFQKAVSGFIVSENKTLEAINRMFVQNARHQSSFNRFFGRQNFDLAKLNTARIRMLQSLAGTRFKPKGVLSIDNSLLKHYGKHFDNIYYHFDYVHKCYRWAHDLVTLHYSDEQTDYPLLWQLWEPPDWDSVAEYLSQQGFTINNQKWEQRKEQPQQWRNYIRARYKDGRKKHPGVVDIYQTKNHIGFQLIEQFKNQHPDKNYPVVLDSGFSSAELCQDIKRKLGLDYVGSLREEQYINQPKTDIEIKLSDLVAQLRSQAQAGTGLQKLTFKYQDKKQECYAYFANHRIRGFDKKQRLVISFLREDLSDRPSFTFTNRLDWYPSGILRIRRHRWPIETYHQEGKAEGLEDYQVRHLKAIQSYIALIVVAYSMLKCTLHDDALLSSIQQRLQTEMGSTLPFLRRLMKAESLMLLLEHIFIQVQQGQSWQEAFHSISPLMV
jgi:hypothetical protein